MSNTKVIMFDSDEAAQPATLTLADGTTRQLWVGGGFAYREERDARYAGCTHRQCQHCGAPAEKSWTVCDSCRANNQRKRFEALEAQPWDGTSPVCLYDGEKYFWDIGELEEWLEGEGIDRDDVMLVHAVPRYAPELTEEYFGDYLPDESEGDVPKELVAAIDAFNAALRAYGQPLCWTAGKVRVSWDESAEVKA